MIPVKELLTTKLLEPGPPILVIDETTIKCTVDAGPICQCFEKYCAVKNYVPFVPGGLNPYQKKKRIEYKSSDSDRLLINWQHLSLGSSEPTFNKPVAYLPEEVSKNFKPRKYDFEDFMHLSIPRHTEEYLHNKMKQCRGEVDDCPKTKKNEGARH